MAGAPAIFGAADVPSARVLSLAGEPRSIISTMAPDRDWVELRRCTALHEAQFIRSLLESEGIDAMITGEYSVGVQPFLGVMPGGIPVLVRAADLGRASDLLDSADE